MQRIVVEIADPGQQMNQAFIDGDLAPGDAAAKDVGEGGEGLLVALTSCREWNHVDLFVVMQGANAQLTASILRGGEGSAQLFFQGALG